MNREMDLQLAKCEDAVDRTRFLIITASLEETLGVNASEVRAQKGLSD